MQIRFAILGPVQVHAGDRPLAGTAPRHRAVLGYLLLHAGTVVSLDRLIDAMWGLTPPDTARAQIHAAATAIRRTLRTADPAAAQLLTTRDAGYLIAPGPGQFDLAEFTAEVGAARGLADSGDVSAAVERLRAALGLWRGEPLADINADYAADARARLTDRRLTAVERLFDLRLTLAEPGATESAGSAVPADLAELVDELSAELASHPLRERLAALLMRALYRTGRTADALAAARGYRQRLADEQGLDPGRAFTALEQAILRDDPSLHTGSRPGRPEPSGSDPRPEPAPGVTAQRPRAANFLPYDIADFAGRSTELDRLAGWLGGSVVTISAIDGMAGVGKTALAVHAGHRLAARFPDGQLFVDLRAHTAGQSPLEPSAALETLLRQIGIAPEQIPPSAVDRAAMWRAELTDRQVLVVLDNAANAEHVRPLLPGTSPSLMLITSRRRLTDLDGPHALSVDLLPARDAVELFTRIVGDRAAAEPIAVMDVLQLCGFLPLAVRIAAARLQHRPQWTVQHLADRLRDRRRRLTELSTADRGVAAAFSLSYQQLDDDKQRMFRLLSQHPGRDLDVYAASALAGWSVARAEPVLESLLDAHVLMQHEPGRYTFHDLLREHARSVAASTDSDDTRRAALTRLFGHYRHTARRATDLLFPSSSHLRPQIPTPEPDPDGVAPDLVPMSDAAALTWLDAERANLVAVAGHAAEHQWPEHACHLAALLSPYVYDYAHHVDALTLHTHALRAADLLDDRPAQARANIALGWLNLRGGGYEPAEQHFRRALALSQAAGERVSQARALNALGNLYWRRRDPAQALEHFRPALALYQDLDEPVGLTHALGNIGIMLAELGQYQQAVDHLRQALDRHQASGERGLEEAIVLSHLGQTLMRQGRYELARQYHRQALDRYRALGNHSEEADSLNGLGEAARYVDEPAEAVREHSAALTLAGDAGNRPQQARAHHGLARAHRDLGRPDLASEHATQALDLYVALGEPEADNVRAFLTTLGRNGTTG